LSAGSVVVASPVYAATVALEHVCKVIGDDNPLNGSGYHQAVICTDLLQVDDGRGGFIAEARTEAFCQTSTGTGQACASIQAIDEVAHATANGTVTSAAETGCGPAVSPSISSGACPAGRLFLEGAVLGDALCIPNVWAVTLGDRVPGDETQIWLPGSDKAVLLLANYGTPHTNVGNSC
jgi:hypothetical protein